MSWQHDTYIVLISIPTTIFDTQIDTLQYDLMGLEVSTHEIIICPKLIDQLYF